MQECYIPFGVVHDEFMVTFCGKCIKAHFTPLRKIQIKTEITLKKDIFTKTFIIKDVRI